MKKALKVAAVVLAIALVLAGVGFSIFLNARTWWLQRDQKLVYAGAQQAVSFIIQSVKQKGEVELAIPVGEKGKEQTIRAVLVEKQQPVAASVDQPKE